MAGQPNAAGLIAVVRDFLAGLAEAHGDAAPALTGRDAFHARVAANALAIVARELDGAADATEAAALVPFADHPRLAGVDPHLSGDQEAVSALRADLCAAIRAGDLGAATPGLLAALIVATQARLRVDNPRYATLARLDTVVALPADDAALRR